MESTVCPKQVRGAMIARDSKRDTRARTCTQMRSCTHTCSCTHTDKHASAHIHCKSERQSAVAGWPNSFSNFLAGVCITPSAFNLLCSVSDLVPPPKYREQVIANIHIESLNIFLSMFWSKIPASNLFSPDRTCSSFFFHFMNIDASCSMLCPF